MFVGIRPDQAKALQAGILSAFPSASSLEQAVYFGDSLGVRLGDIVGPGPLAKRVFDLIEWANSVSKVLVLAEALHAAVPGNAELAKVTVLLRQALFEAEPPPPQFPPSSASAPPSPKPWFQELPLDWTRDDTRQVHRALVVAYDTNYAAIALAKNAGLSVATLNQMQPVSYLLREMLDKARTADCLELLLLEVLLDPSVAGVFEAIRDTIAGWEAAFEAAALRRRPTYGAIARVPSSARLRAPSGQETLLNAAAAFVDPVVLRLQLARAEACVGQVFVDGAAAGSGFLVGDSLLLTNWHVVKGLVGDKKGSVVFDHKRLGNGAVAMAGREVAFAADWQVAHSEDADDAAELGANGPPPDRLDYALVLLAEPVGAQGIAEDRSGDRRDHFKLTRDAREFQRGEPLYVLGHPQGRPLQLSFASPSNAVRTPTNVRVRYQTNTDVGSSGSPVLDRGWKVVALHNVGGAMNNQGVPVDCIATDLARRLAKKPEVLDALTLV